MPARAGSVRERQFDQCTELPEHVCASTEEAMRSCQVVAERVLDFESPTQQLQGPRCAIKDCDAIKPILIWF